VDQHLWAIVTGLGRGPVVRTRKGRYLAHVKR
jgi:hypothetical protein